MKRTAARGAVWIVFSYGLMLILRFASNLILTWFLAPRILGVMALVNLLVMGLQMFSDLGIRQWVIQHPRGDDPALLRTAWTLQILRGLFLWFCATLLAWPLAVFYEEPALLWLLPTVGASAAFDGFQSTSVFTLSRRLLRGRLVLLEVGPYVVSMSLVIGWVWWLAKQGLPGSAETTALQTGQLTALAIGVLCSGLCKTVLSYLIQPGFQHRFHLDQEARSQVLGFGGWVFVSTACMFLAAQADRLVVGRISLDVLGVYHVAVGLASIPTLLMSTLGSQLVFPLFSRTLHGKRDLSGIYAQVHPLFSVFAALLAAGLASTGPTVVRCLYPTRYVEAGWYLQLLAAGSWFTMLQVTREMMLLAQGRPRALAAAQMIRLLSLPPLLLGGFQFAGLTGLILGFTTSEFIRCLVNVWQVREQRLSFLFNDLPLSLLIAGLSLASARVGPLLGEASPRFARFALEAVFVVTAWALVVAVWQSWRRGLFRRPARPEPTEEARA